MFAEERHSEIVSLLKQEGRVTVNGLAEKFEVSIDTIRRDLVILEENGLLKRTHGGAIPTRQVGVGKPAKITARDFIAVKENYLAIAKRAVAMIQDNDVVFITSATVGFFMAQNIPDTIKIRAVTNSIIIAEELRKKENVSVILLGGEMDPKGNCYDAFANEMISRLRFDKCFLTAACISADFGLSIQKSSAIPFWNAVMKSSMQSIGLFPTEKIGFESIVQICPANKLDTIITDWDAPEDELTKLKEQGIELVIVEKE